MMRNYLKIIIRNLRRHKTFGFINVAGLAVGMAACLLIFLYVADEVSFDRYHTNADRIFRLAVQVEGASYENGLAKVSDLWGPGAKAEIPEVVDATRFVSFGPTLVERGERRQFEGGGMYADSATFDMFTWPMLQGDPETALVGPDKVVLTTSFAQRWFGDEDPMGQTLVMDNASLRTVSGVIADVPANSHFTFDFLVSLESYYHERRGDWISWNQFFTYLLLAPSADPSAVAAKFDAVLDRRLEPGYADSYYPLLQPIVNIHLHSKLHREMAPNSDIRYVYIFSTIALFILLIACTNFVSLSTARASQRAQEVGVRKVSGANRVSLIRQFLGESILLCTLAIGFAWALAFVLLDTFNRLAGKGLTSEALFDPQLIIGLLVAAAFVGASAGVYPAFVLSSFSPVRVLKGDTGHRGGAAVRKGLVVFQFTISACLLIAAGVVFDQLSYVRDKDLGFDKGQVIIVPANEVSTVSRYETIKAQLLDVGGVESVSFSGNRPGGSDWGIPVDFEGIPDDQEPSVRMLCVDHDFIDTYGIEVVEGRGFSRGFGADTTTYMLNEAAAKAIGWTMAEPGRIGMPVIGRDFGDVIGIVKDFHFRSMHERIAPLILFIQPAMLSTLNIRIRASTIEETLASIERIMVRHEPKYPFVYRFFDEQFDALHAAEERTGNLLAYFAALAIFIASLGLIGLASFSAERRTKEIGIRKVLGAGVAGILVLLSTDIAILVLIGVALASPIGYFAMNEWLSSFAYSAGIGLSTFVIAGVGLMVLAIGATCLQSARAALVDPVGTLRHQ